MMIRFLVFLFFVSNLCADLGVDLFRLEQAGKGRLVFFLVNEFTGGRKLPVIELHAKGLPAIQIPKIEADETRAVYKIAFDLPAGEYTYTLALKRERGVHNVEMQLLPLAVLPGRITLFTHHWGQDSLFSLRLANTRIFEDAVDRHLEGQKPFVDYWPLMETSASVLDVHLDLDFRERLHASKPQIIVYAAFLNSSEGESFPAQILYEGQQSFGSSDEKYTHSYYVLSFEDDLPEDECFDLELKGVSLLDGKKILPFEPSGAIWGKQAVCPDLDQTLSVKGYRVKNNEWILERVKNGTVR